MQLYFNTSIYGGFYDAEFDLWTKLLFRDCISKEIRVLYSDIVNAELHKAHKQVNNLASIIPSDQFIRVTTDKEVENPVRKYISENVVGETCYLYCLHITLITSHIARLEDELLLIAFFFI